MSDLPDISHLKIEGPIARAIAESRRAFEAKPVSPPPEYAQALRLFTGFDNPQTNRAAADTLLALTKEDPKNLFWLQAIIFMLVDVESREVIDELLTRPELQDTTSIQWKYIQAALNRRDPRREALLLEALEQTDRLPPLQMAILRKRCITMLGRQGRNLEGLDFALAILPEVRSVGGQVMEAGIWTGIGDILMNLHRMDEALHASYHAESLLQGFDQPREQCLTRSKIGSCFFKRGETEETLTVLSSLITMSRKHKLASIEVMTLTRLSPLLCDLNEYHQALAGDRRALELAYELGETRHLPLLQLNIADNFTSLGQLDSALANIREASRLAERYPNPRTSWATLVDESNHWLLVGDYRKASELDSLAALIMPQMHNPDDMNLRYLGLVRHAREMGRLETAFAALDSLEHYADDNSGKLPGLDFHFQANIEAASLYLETGEHDIAWQRLQRAAEELTSRFSHRRASRYWSTRGMLLDASGDPESALAALDSAMVHAEAENRSGRISRQRLLLVKQHLNLGQVPEARRLFEGLGKYLGGDTSYRTHQLRTLIEVEIEMAEERWRDAARLLQQVLGESGDRLSRDLAVRYRIELAKTLHQLKKKKQALTHLADAGILLRTSQAGIRDYQTRLLLGDLIRDCYELWIQILLDGRNSSENLARQTFHLRQEMMALILDHRIITTPPSFETLTMAFLFGEENSYQWILNSSSAQVMELSETRAITDAAGQLHLAVSQPDRKLPVRACRLLSRKLLTPLKGHWQPGQTVNLLPDGPVHGLHWAVLPWQGDQVLDHGSLVQIGWTGNGNDSNRIANGEAILIMADNGIEQDRLPVLLNAEVEARSIEKLWPGPSKLLLGEECSAAGLRQSGGENLRAIHLAMHADINYGRSGGTRLMMSDGRGGIDELTAAELAKLDLPCQLVYLSCCNTSHGALSNNQAIPDLARAFLQAGAGVVITASQTADDEAAMQLALSFYRFWLGNIEIPEALRLAQLEMRERSDKYSAPYYWAPFQLVIRY